MEDITLAVIVIASVVALTQLWRYLYGQQLHLPGPSRLQALINMKVRTIHLQIDEWRHKYGNIFQVPLPRTNLVVLNGYQAIHEALVTKGDIFSAKSEMYALKTITENYRGAFCGWADQRWRLIRKTCMLHVKQYGKNRLEPTSANQAHHLVKSLETNSGKEIDTYKLLYSASLNTIYKLVCGKSLPENSPWEENIIEYERLVIDTFLDPMSFILNIVPVYCVYETQLTTKINRILSMMNEIWYGMIKNNLTRFDENSLVPDLLHENEHYEEIDVKQTIMSVFVAGIATTSNSFYALINILLHKFDIKSKLEKEIFHVIGSSRRPKLQDRQQMMYARAIIFELLRYHTVLPNGFIRETTEETSICGHPLPVATKIMFNLWGLHHDEKFWGDPWEFRPERFLSESGDELVPADHPNRRHLMPFSAGPRVCLGETIALDQLFIWLVTVVQRFDLQPGEVDVPYDVRTYEMTSMLRHPQYRARFVPRV